MPTRRALFALPLALAAPRAQAAEDLSLLARPGHFGIMRHALAPGGGDPPGLRIDDCATQRNLSDQGRAQAARIGARLRAAGIAELRVFTSQWCRCRDTAALLGFGPPQDLAVLNSFFADRASGQAQTAALRAWIANMPADVPVMLVTHQVNITALTGVFPASGELVVARRDPGGLVVPAGRVTTD